MKIKPKKSLGQNFLTDEGVIQKIIEGANLQKEDVVLEVGPGKGILTEALASKCQKVLAVEIDERKKRGANGSGFEKTVSARALERVAPADYFLRAGVLLGAWV